MTDRAKNSRDLRIAAADEEYRRSQGVMHPDNSDESDYDNTFIGNYSKGLRHNPKTGEVLSQDYELFRKAAFNEDPIGFGAIPQGFTPEPESNKKYFKLTNPLCGLAFDLEGPDSHAVVPDMLTITNMAGRPFPPKLSSDDAAAEIAELYWMALCRDINFTEFEDHDTIKQAVDSLNGDFGAYKNWPSNPLTAATIFRGNFKGDNTGPFISQFLFKGNKDDVLGKDERDGFIKFGAATYDQRIVVGLSDKDYITNYDSWLSVQNGEDRTVSLLESDPPSQLKNYYDPTPRFIRNMRDLTSYVHMDVLYQAYLNALIYLSRLPTTEYNKALDPGNPYLKDHRYKNQQGFGTFSSPHILSLTTEAASRALKAAWYLKWFIHRRLRPEAFGGLIHLTKTGQRNYPISKKILNSMVLYEIVKRNKYLNEKYNGYDVAPSGEKDYFLPIAFPEGSPTHPSFPAGHATVGGACVTILKAWFNEEYPILKPVISEYDGTILKYYTGSDKDDLTLGGELNKLAANIAIGRNMAGIHYRSDYIQSIRLGEMIGIGILQDQRNIYSEDYSLTLKREYRFIDTENDLVIRPD